MNSPAPASVELPSTSAGDTPNLQGGPEGPLGDYQFQKPEWLRWWLRSLYMLEPADQIEVAARVMEVVHVKTARDVLESFILEVGEALPEDGSATSALGRGGQAKAADDGAAREAEDDEDARAWMAKPLWQRLLLVSWARYKWLVVGGSLVLLVYAWKGIAILLKLAGGG